MTSGRCGRPLPLLVTSLVLVALTWTSASTASSATVSVKPSQELVALLRPQPVRSQPGTQSAVLSLVPALTPITGVRTTLPVLGRSGQWLKVRLPGRPNSHTGWISRVGTTRFAVGWHLVVDRSRRQVSAYRAGKLIRVFKAVVGKSSTPTPAGEFFVEEAVELRAFDVGAPFALALSARSNVLQEFDGGPGQVALHGLSNVGGVLGSALSHGCVRLDNDTMRWLVVRIGPGTPVTIAG